MIFPDYHKPVPPRIRCSVDLLTLPRDVTHNFTLPLLTKDNEPRGEDCCIHFSLCITGNQMEDGGKTGEGGKMLEDGCAKSQHKYVRFINLIGCCVCDSNPALVAAGAAEVSRSQGHQTEEYWASLPHQ